MKYLRTFPVTLLFAFLLVGCDGPGPGPNDTTTNNGPVDPPATAPAAAPETPRHAPINLDDETDTDHTGGNRTIDGIRAAYAEVMSAVNSGNLDETDMSFTCANRDGEIRLTHHRNNAGKVILLEAVTGIGHEFTITKYYFKDDEPFFVYEIVDYTGPANLPAGETVDDNEGVWHSEIEERRFYLNNDGNIIRALEKKYQENSWEEPVKTENVPNQIIKSRAGQSFPNLGTVVAWREGREGC